jgi:predicted esterase
MALSRRVSLLWVACTLAALLPLAGMLSADDTLVLKDGRELTGRVAMVTSVAENPAVLPPADAPRMIVIVDNQLTRSFLPKLLLQEVRQAPASAHEVFHIPQQVARAGARIGSLGQILRVTLFDEFGRRIFSMRGATASGQIDVVQGITVITPVWTKVEALETRTGVQYLWDMRIATSSIPADVLAKLLARQVDRTKPDDRLRIVRFYLQAERYRDAQRELEGVLADFPELANLSDQLSGIRQLAARRLLEEIEMRRASGQHRLAYTLLTNFPAEDDVAGAIKQQARTLATEYTTELAHIEQTQKSLAAHLDSIEETTLRTQLAPAIEEIVRELNINTLVRMADYRRLAQDNALDARQKLALAISGWLLGGHEASENVTLALSLYAARNAVRDYLAEPMELKRADLLDLLRREEAAAPRYVAKLIEQMRPPLASQFKDGAPPGFFELAVPGLAGEPDVDYYVQLPPEYDPYRRYPAVITLCGAVSTPINQLDWWAGEPQPDRGRFGQAARHGYIIVAPQWKRPGQDAYQYSAREHAAVLATLRDACRRFAVDTDRVYLSGHSAGGDAAWDIGLAHPDLWAGVIPIGATSDRYIVHYTANARYVPLYFIGGELDADRALRNSRDLDRYLTDQRAPNFNVTVVEYLGRGHEHFQDEIQSLFDWMGRHKRSFFPKEFTTSTMRSWDNFFWWVEMHDLPPATTVDPVNWPPPRGTRPMTVRATVGARTINIATGAGRVTVWLSPELVDFNERLRVTVGRRTFNAVLPEPDLRTLLEDARTRGDRQHPFWARLDFQLGRSG